MPSCSTTIFLVILGILLVGICHGASNESSLDKNTEENNSNTKRETQTVTENPIIRIQPLTYTPAGASAPINPAQYVSNLPGMSPITVTKTIVPVVTRAITYKMNGQLSGPPHIPGHVAIGPVPTPIQLFTHIPVAALPSHPSLRLPQLQLLPAKQISTTAQNLNGISHSPTASHYVKHHQQQPQHYMHPFLRPPTGMQRSPIFEYHIPTSSPVQPQVVPTIQPSTSAADASQSQIAPVVNNPSTTPQPSQIVSNTAVETQEEQAALKAQDIEGMKPPPPPPNFFHRRRRLPFSLFNAISSFEPLAQFSGNSVQQVQSNGLQQQQQQFGPPQQMFHFHGVFPRQHRSPRLATSASSQQPQRQLMSLMHRPITHVVYGGPNKPDEMIVLQTYAAKPITISGEESERDERRVIVESSETN